MDKAAFRKKYKALRAELSFEDIDQMSLEIANKVLELPIWDKTNYHIFLPIESQKELNTQYLLHILQGRDKSIIVPKVIEETTSLEHYLLQENTTLVLSKYQVPEPSGGIVVAPSQIEIVFVPLLAYDIQGNRIGYGKGYYDRFLRQCREGTLFIGLSLFPPDKSLPNESTDIPLHYCVSPLKISAY